jgi:hypothetical protein
MLSRWIVLATVVAVLPTPGRAQDSQSLGDLARQVRSQRSNAPTRKVITNDELPSGSAVSAFGLQKPDTEGLAKPDQGDSALASLAQWEQVVQTIDSMDRAALLKGALQGGNPDFPGHEKWEDRLFAAKQTYVTQGRDLIRRARELVESARSLQNAKATPDDPRVKALSENLKALIGESVRADAAFQAVILEGRDMAHQPPR